MQADGKDDKIFTPSSNEEVNIQITNALIGKVNDLQKKIEKDSTMGGQVKVLYIRGLERLLRDLNANWKYGRFVVTYLPEMFQDMKPALILIRKKKALNILSMGLSMMLHGRCLTVLLLKKIEVTKHQRIF